MVNDPRVTRLLSRLGGLYRDPSRVDRDASSLLKSTAGMHLNPGIAALVENNGESSNCLVLQGTIAMPYRGTTYQQLVDIYLPPGYPIRPPISFVRLTQNMYLKENHPHVGSDGMVYMPYTHEWNPRTHSLIEMVVAMSSIFSANPPVFTKAAPPPPPAPAPAPAPAPIPQATAVIIDPPPPAYSANIGRPFNSDSDRYMQQQVEAIMAKEAEEANRAAEAARLAAKEEEDRERQIAEQRKWELEKERQVRDKVNAKIIKQLEQLSLETRKQVQSDHQDQQSLKRSQEKIKRDINFLEQTNKELEANILIVEEKTKEIEEWLEESKDTAEQELTVDEMCQPASTLHAQMLDLSAENSALDDALYYVDRSMFTGNMDCVTHLKSVRKLAKRQFLVKAHLLKINQFVLNNGSGV